MAGINRLYTGYCELLFRLCCGELVKQHLLILYNNRITALSRATITYRKGSLYVTHTRIYTYILDRNLFKCVFEHDETLITY